MKPPRWIIYAALPRLVGTSAYRAEYVSAATIHLCSRTKNISALQAFYIATPQNGGTLTRTSKTASVILERHIGSPVGEVGIMCFDRKLLLQVEQIAWDEFRHMRDSTWSPDAKILRAHDNALAASQKLRDHVAVCDECRESGPNGTPNPSAHP
jgi:hypothetical protein